MEGGKKGGGKRVPRHQRMRPSRLSMDLVDTPSADPPPVLGEMSAAASSSPSPWGTHSPVGTIRHVAERLPTAPPGSSKSTKSKGKKQQQGGHSPRSPQQPQQPQQPQDRRHTHPRVSSPLCTEVGVASVRSPKAAAAAVFGVGGSKLAVERPRGESDPDLEELPLDQSGDKEQQEGGKEGGEGIGIAEGCSPRRGGGAVAAGAGAGAFRPLSPLVLPVLRSPSMRMVLSAEKLERLAQAFEGGEGQQYEAATATTASPKHAGASTSIGTNKPRMPREGAGESSGGRSGSPAVVVETLKSLAKKAVAAASASIAPPSGAVPAAGAAALPTPIVAPTPIRPVDPADAPTKSPTNTPAGVIMPPLPPISPFTQVKPHGYAGGLGSSVSFAPPTKQQPIPHITGLAGSGGGLLGAVVSFPFVVGACLLACGLSHAGIEWYTTTLGSDFSTWWAGAVCAFLGAATMAFRRTPNLGLLGVGISRKHAAQALYGLLALGAVAAIIAALFLDLKLLDGLNKADRCGAASDNLVLDNGIVLTQTMGAACGVPTGCACVQYTTPIPGGEVTCLNFPRAAPETCASIPYGVAGLVRVSIWCIAGLLFFMAVLLLRAGGVAPEERSSKVRSLMHGRGGSAAYGQRRQRRRRNTWHANANAAAVVVGVGMGVGGLDEGENEGVEGDGFEDEEEEEDVEESIVQGLDVAAMNKEALARMSLHRSAQLLTPIPEEGADGAASAVVPAHPEMATAGVVAT